MFDEDGVEGFFGGGVDEGTEEKVTDCVAFIPFTVMEPEDFDTLYPDMLPMVYEYVPLGREKVIVFVVDDSVVPFKVIDHDVPEERPDSVNVTVYNFTKLTDLDAVKPATETEPEDADGLYV